MEFDSRTQVEQISGVILGKFLLGLGEGGKHFHRRVGKTVLEGASEAKRLPEGPRPHLSF